MVKEPVAGRVKTRLGREIGMTSAAWWFRHQSRGMLRRLQDPRWQIVLAVSPDWAGLNSRVWPAHLPRIPQGRGDLGRRMARALAVTSGPTLLIGSDIPSVTRHHIATAFQALGAAPAVVGPSDDGGFWLVGLSHPQRQPVGVFKDVQWSYSETLRDALPTLPQPVVLIDTLSDVDTVDDLKPRDVCGGAW